MAQTTWIEVLPERGAFLFTDSAKMRKVAGDQVSIKSDEAGMSIKCIDENQAQEIITLLRGLGHLEQDYRAWIIPDADWQNWSPETAKGKAISIPRRSARRARSKETKNQDN